MQNQFFSRWIWGSNSASTALLGSESMQKHYISFAEASSTYFRLLVDTYFRLIAGFVCKTRLAR